MPNQATRSLADKERLGTNRKRRRQAISKDYGSVAQPITREPKHSSGLESSSERSPRSFSTASTSSTSSRTAGQDLPKGSTTSTQDIPKEDSEDKVALRRARNRTAAYKSRAKKSVEISNLEDNMQKMRDRRAELSTYVEELKSEVFMLKNEVLVHGQCDCPPIKQYLGSVTEMLAPALQPEPEPSLWY